jgi:hypothetical protein
LAAAYVDRAPKGEKPADLPVQHPNTSWSSMQRRKSALPAEFHKQMPVVSHTIAKLVTRIWNTRQILRLLRLQARKHFS